MSRFLGPIHYIMFEKIQYLNKIVNSMKDLVDEDIDLNEIETGELSDLIDTDNIHGWLQQRVSLVEDNLAKVLSVLKSEGKLDEGYKIAFDFGKNENFSGDATEAFQYMSDKFLDGMPCDMANLPIESDSNDFRWIKRLDVHKAYYIYGCDVSVYDDFRKSWLDGLLSNSDLSYEIEDNINIIK